MFSKVKNFLNLKRRAKPARQLQVNEQDDQILPNPRLLPEVKRLSFNVQTLAEPQLQPVLDHPIIEQDNRTSRLPEHNQTLTNPRFPPELERLIFEYAARGYRGTIPSLIRVASRVKQWVESFLYETVIFRIFPYCPPDRRRMLAIHGKSVQHLFLRDGMSFVSAWDYLHSCQNLRTLTFFADELAENPLPPHDSSWSSFRTQCPYKFPVYQHLTHLELLTAHSPVRWMGWLASLPNLTYLFILSPMANIDGAVEQILASCLKIRVMLWCPWKGRFRDERGEPTKEQIQAIKLGEAEPRLVVCKVSYEQFTKHFVVHAEEKSDSETMWKVAEQIINKRRETGTTNYADIVNAYRFKALL